MRRISTIVFAAAAFAVILCGYSTPAATECDALDKLNALISQWESERAIHPDRIGQLKTIAAQLKPCLQKEGGYANFNGVWQTNWGRMELTQIGNSVEGTYQHDGGRITGFVEGNVLRGVWSEAPTYSEPKDKGQVEFTLSPDGRRFEGKWRYGSTGQWQGGWTGQR